MGRLCDDCGVELTLEELEYYGSRCDGCEKDWSQAMDDWRHGRTENPEFERLYGDTRPKPTKH